MLTGTKEAIINTLCDELKLKILSHLPPSAFIGPNAVSSVCQDWHTLTNDITLKGKKSRSALIDSCKHFSEALVVLSEDCFINRLRFDEILSIASQHPEMALEILTKHPERLDSKMIVKLGKTELAAQYILTTEALCNKLDGYHLAWLGSTHLASAICILNNPTLCNKLSGFDLVVLGDTHHDIALRILTTGTLCNKLDGSALSKLGRNHHDIALRILDTEDLSNKLTGSNLADLVSYHPAFAIRILNNPTLCNKLDGYDLAKLGCAHPGAAKHILNTANLVRMLAVKDLAKIERHIQLANEIQNIAAQLKLRTLAQQPVTFSSRKRIRPAEVEQLQTEATKFLKDRGEETSHRKRRKITTS